MPKFTSGYSEEVIEICREDAPSYSCEKCVATVEECIENLKESAEIWNDFQLLKQIMNSK